MTDKLSLVRSALLKAAEVNGTILVLRAGQPIKAMTKDYHPTPTGLPSDLRLNRTEIMEVLHGLGGLNIPEYTDGGDPLRMTNMYPLGRKSFRFALYLDDTRAEASFKNTGFRA